MKRFELFASPGPPVLDVPPSPCGRGISVSFCISQRSHRMRAVRVHEFGGPGNMRLEEIEDPSPGPRQLVIAVKAAGINPIDTYIRSGSYAKKKPTLPYTPGFDAAGIVESIGAEIRRFKAGDRVYINGNVTGAYAEKTLCAEENVFP